MKKLLFGLPLMGLLLAACSNEFDVVAPWKDLPVVYGIISPQDTAVYIRVEKAFLDPERSALEIAQIADSLYYPQSAISVFLQKGNGPRFELERVDGAQEGYPRQGGVFAGQPNYLYKIRPADMGGIIPAETYTLIVERGDGKPTVTAQTTVPKNFRFINPNPQTLVPTVTFTPNKSQMIEWRSDKYAAYFNLTFVVRIREINADGSQTDKTLVWTPYRNYGIGDDVINGTEYKTVANVPGISFHQFLINNLTDLTVQARYFELTDIVLKGGGLELREFQETSSANSGLTGAEVIPVFSNVEEGRGLFLATNTTVFPGVRISSLTVDSLQLNPDTQGLRFSN